MGRSSPDNKFLSFFLFRRQNRQRRLISVTRYGYSAFFQFAQSFFFLLLFLCQILLALFELIVRFCQFIPLPTGRLDRRSSKSSFQYETDAPLVLP